MKKTLSLLALAALLFTTMARADGTQAQKVTPYALKTCFITGDDIGGDMGKPVVFTYKGQQIKLCCKKCLRKFNADPDKAMKEYQAAVQKSKG